MADCRKIQKRFEKRGWGSPTRAADAERAPRLALLHRTAALRHLDPARRHQTPGRPPGRFHQRADSAGIELEPEAARAMVSAIGAELGILMREMDKLSAYVADRRRITRADVEAVVGVIPRHNRWAWRRQSLQVA